MIRKLSTLLALMMAFSVQVSANEYTNEAYAVYVDSMEFVTSPEGERQVQLTLPNLGQEPIEALIIEIAMLDDNKQPFLAYPANAEGFNKELRAGSISAPLTFSDPLQPGTKGIHTQTIGPEYEQATIARAAVIYYRRASGEEFYISPTVMLWNHTDGTRLTPAAGGLYYPGLTQEQHDLAYSFPMGFTSESRMLYDYLAPAYGLTEGGMWVMEVGEGSLAEKLGLKAGDLVVSVDGVRLAEDMRAFELGKTKMAQGETIEYVWVRDGETMRGTIAKE